MSARAIHPATEASILLGGEPQVTGHLNGHPLLVGPYIEYRCGCSPVPASDPPRWWLCQYHDGYDDGYTAAVDAP